MSFFDNPNSQEITAGGQTYNLAPPPASGRKDYLPDVRIGENIDELGLAGTNPYANGGGGGGGGARGAHMGVNGAAGAAGAYGGGFDPADMILGTDGHTVYGYKRAYDVTTGKSSYETVLLGDGSTPAGQAAIAAASGIPAGAVAARFQQLKVQFEQQTQEGNKAQYGQVLSSLGNGQWLIQNADGTQAVKNLQDASRTPGVTNAALMQAENERLYNDYRGNEAGFANATWDPTKLATQYANGTSVGPSGQSVFSGNPPPNFFMGPQEAPQQGGYFAMPGENAQAPTQNGVAQPNWGLYAAQNGTPQQGGMAQQGGAMQGGAMPGAQQSGAMQQTNPLTASGSSLTQPNGGQAATPSGAPTAPQGGAQQSGAIFAMPKTPDTTTSASGTTPSSGGTGTAPTGAFSTPPGMTNWQAGNLDTQLRQAQEFGAVNKFQHLTAGPGGSYSGTDFFGNHVNLTGDQVANSGSATAAEQQGMQQDYSQQQRQFGLQMRMAKSQDLTGYDPNQVGSSIAGVH